MGWAEGSIEICVGELDDGFEAEESNDEEFGVWSDAWPYFQFGNGACVVLIGSEESKGGRLASVALKSSYFGLRTKGLGLALLDILAC